MYIIACLFLPLLFLVHIIVRWSDIAELSTFSTLTLTISLDTSHDWNAIVEEIICLLILLFVFVSHSHLTTISFTRLSYSWEDKEYFHAVKRVEKEREASGNDRDGNWFDITILQDWFSWILIQKVALIVSLVYSPSCMLLWALFVWRKCSSFFFSHLTIHYLIWFDLYTRHTTYKLEVAKSKKTSNNIESWTTVCFYDDLKQKFSNNFSHWDRPKT